MFWHTLVSPPPPHKGGTQHQKGQHGSTPANTIGRDAAIADIDAPALHCTCINAGGFVCMQSIRRSGQLVTLFMVILTVLAGSASALAKAPRQFTATPLTPVSQYSATITKD